MSKFAQRDDADEDVILGRRQLGRESRPSARSDSPEGSGLLQELLRESYAMNRKADHQPE